MCGCSPSQVKPSDYSKPNNVQIFPAISINYHRPKVGPELPGSASPSPSKKSLCGGGIIPIYGSKNNYDPLSEDQKNIPSGPLEGGKAVSIQLMPSIKRIEDRLSIQNREDSVDSKEKAGSPGPKSPKDRLLTKKDGPIPPELPIRLVTPRADEALKKQTEPSLNALSPKADENRRKLPELIIGPRTPRAEADSKRRADEGSPVVRKRTITISPNRPKVDSIGSTNSIQHYIEKVQRMESHLRNDNSGESPNIILRVSNLPGKEAREPSPKQSSPRTTKRRVGSRPTLKVNEDTGAPINSIPESIDIKPSFILTNRITNGSSEVITKSFQNLKEAWQKKE